MKTVKGLRTAVANCGGELKIGQLRFKGKEGSDVDIYVDDKLIAWIVSSVKDEERLEEIYMTVNSDAFANPSKDKEAKENKENKEKLESQVTSLNEEVGGLRSELELAKSTIKSIQESGKEDKTKIAVYEKMFNREIVLKSGS